ncbi:MAG TPA: LysR family transcriptional regulator [Acetobacteraceae bacterium]|nr:LysR family transcriptional regulator [Acetobacteraceae bacterium]
MPRGPMDLVPHFLLVAERRSFTAAAAELGVTAAAVSYSIKQLEARVGVALFARTTRDVALTEAGLRFLELARPGAVQIEQAFAAARSLGSEPAGLLRLNLPRVALAGIIEPLLDGFCAAYPQVELEIAVSDQLVNIVEQGFDAGIRVGEMLEADMVAVRLLPSFRYCVVAAPSYLREHGTPERPEELRQHRCINYRQPTRGTLYRWEFTDSDGREMEIAVSGRIITNDSGVMMMAAVKGKGLAYTLDPTAAPLVAQGKLQRVLEPYCPSSPGFFLYFPSRAQVMPKLRAFIDYARSHLANVAPR